MSDASISRYGIKWNGPESPVCVQMPDSYWTPWHVAQAELARLRAENEKLARVNDRMHELAQSHLDEKAKLRAENERTRKDADRYRFLRGDSGPTSKRWPLWQVQYWTGFWNPVQGKEMDAAIDAAMGGEGAGRD